MKKENKQNKFKKIIQNDYFKAILRGLVFGLLVSKSFVFYSALFQPFLTNNVLIYVENVFMYFFGNIVYSLISILFITSPFLLFVLTFVICSIILQIITLFIKKLDWTKKRIYIFLILNYIFLIILNIYFGLPYEMGGGAFS